jgi:hypothetical protein
MSIVQTQTLNGETESSDPSESAQNRPHEVCTMFHQLTAPTHTDQQLTLSIPEDEERESASAITRPPTSAEIDAVIAAAMANAPPVPSPYDDGKAYSL